ncbi:hypothetical protein [Devosia epidermidihirudinis]|uniref:hypothetical protein n=1 Tax=Devosia epidermidihirudinis TaxID=1293439 RepID=UPI000A9F5FB9|nr:hypothetical protein [Devosia epidermidihirudinis]
MKGPPAIVAIILLALCAAHPALADGRADWHDYAWKAVEIETCTAAAGVVTCPLYHQKWDWKRNQWVDIEIAMDLRTGTLQLSQRLTNNDSHDDDYVCVTALVLDAAGLNLLAHHQNWHIDAGQVISKSFTYASPELAKAASVHIGSKQCRKGAGQDDALYARVLAGIQN